LQKLASINSVKRYKSFTVLLLLLFIGSITVSGVALANILNNNARYQVLSEASVLMGAMNSVRDYTNTQIRPKLIDELDTKFFPETVPAYSAQQVFEGLRKQPEYSQLSYKEAVLNPTNLRDKANPFEKEIIGKLRKMKNPLDQSIDGIYNTNQGKFFYIAKAINVSKPSCLQCHSTPDVAPKSMIAYYGAENGFDWQLNEIVGAQFIYLPMEKFSQRNRQLIVGIVAIFAAFLAASTVVIKLWLKQLKYRSLKYL
jgi:hypothetical protein